MTLNWNKMVIRYTLRIGFISFNLSSLGKGCYKFERFRLALFENSGFITATQIKIDESDSQSMTKVLYHQKTSSNHSL